MSIKVAGGHWCSLTKEGPPWAALSSALHHAGVYTALNTGRSVFNKIHLTDTGIPNVVHTGSIVSSPAPPSTNMVEPQGGVQPRSSLVS